MSVTAQVHRLHRISRSLMDNSDLVVVLAIISVAVAVRRLY